MKKYKLLKDLPFAKAGDILKEMLDGDIKVLTPVEWGEQRHSICLNDITNFDEWFEEIKEPKKFWFVDCCGVVRQEEVEEREGSDEAHEEIGNYFETVKEAEKHLEWLKARAVLLKDRGKISGAWGVYHDWRNDKLETYSTDDNSTYCEMMFKNEKDANASIENHEKEWRIYLGVE